MDAIPLCDITKAYTNIYVNAQQSLLKTTSFCTWQNKVVLSNDRCALT